MTKANKLSCIEKEDLKAIMPEFKAAGGSVFSFRNQNVTIAIRPACRAEKPNFFKVSAAFCSPHDKFSKKRGAFEALLKNMDGEFMLVPSQGFSATDTAKALAQFLTQD